MNDKNARMLNAKMASYPVTSPRWGANGRIEITIHDLPENDMSEFEKATKQLNTNVTPTMFNQFLEAMANAGESSKAAALREAVALYCEKHGVKDVDATVDSRGGFRGKQSSLDNLKSK